MAEVIKRIREHQKVFENPCRFITDRGTAFISDDFNENCENESIQHCKITTGVPRGNTQVERINGIVESVFRKLNAEKKGKRHKKTAGCKRHQIGLVNGQSQRLLNNSIRMPDDVNLMQLINEELQERFMDDQPQVREEARQHIGKV